MWYSIRESSASSRHFGLQSELQESRGYIMSSCLKSVTHQVTDRFSLMFDALVSGFWKISAVIFHSVSLQIFFSFFFFCKWSVLHTTVCKYCFCVLCLWCLLSSWTWLSWFHHSVFPFIFGVSDSTLCCLFKTSFCLLPMLLVCQSPSIQVLASPSTVHIPICLCSYLHTFYPKEDTSCRINFKSRM